MIGESLVVLGRSVAADMRYLEHIRPEGGSFLVRMRGAGSWRLLLSAYRNLAAAL